MKKILAAAVVVVICTVGVHSFAADEQKHQTTAKTAAKDDAETPSEGATAHSEHDHSHAEDSGLSVPKGCPLCPVRSADELTVLMTLRERHADIMAREAVVQKRESQAADLERTLDERVAKLDEKMNKLEERLNMAEPGREAKEKRINTLVETLSGLTAKKAAPILAEADPEVAATLLRRMDAAKAAALLAIMPASKAGQFISLGIGTPATKGASVPSAQASDSSKEASP